MMKKKMMEKRWLLAVLGALMVFGLLAGCSGEGGEPLVDTPANSQPVEPDMISPEEPEAESSEPSATE